MYYEMDADTLTRMLGEKQAKIDANTEAIAAAIDEHDDVLWAMDEILVALHKIDDTPDLVSLHYSLCWERELAEDLLYRGYVEQPFVMHLVPGAAG